MDGFLYFKIRQVGFGTSWGRNEQDFAKNNFEKTVS